MKQMLVTAGSTATHIDRVRIVTNIFKGRTGEQIALAAAADGWEVTLLTSRPPPEVVMTRVPGIRRVRYRTFDELAERMEQEIRGGRYDAVVHSAAVSDFRPTGVYRLDEAGSLVALQGQGSDAAKIPSSHDRLFIELRPTFKLIDRIRDPWGFRGKLVKFKLQAGMSDQRLIEIAKRSVVHSEADLIVANCLEWSADYAYVISAAGSVEKVGRDDLPAALLRELS